MADGTVRADHDGCRMRCAMVLTASPIAVAPIRTGREVSDLYFESKT